MNVISDIAKAELDKQAELENMIWGLLLTACDLSVGLKMKPDQLNYYLWRKLGFVCNPGWKFKKLVRGILLDHGLITNRPNGKSFFIVGLGWKDPESPDLPVMSSNRYMFRDDPSYPKEIDL